jgi:hypothetical protein
LPVWVFFLVGVGLGAARDRVEGTVLDASGGHKILVGPSVLGLFGPWGLSVGLLAPVYEDLNDVGRSEPARLITNFSYWF